MQTGFMAPGVKRNVRKGNKMGKGKHQKSSSESARRHHIVGEYIYRVWGNVKWWQSPLVAYNAHNYPFHSYPSAQLYNFSFLHLHQSIHLTK